MTRTTFGQFNIARFFAALCTAAALLLTIPAFSYLNEFTSQSPDHWDFAAFPVTFSINPSVGSNVNGGSAAAISVIKASFDTWNKAPNAAVNVTFAGTSTIATNAADGTNLVCFVCPGDYTKDSTTLAVTFTTIATAAGEDTKHGTLSTFAGQIFDADILFNPSVQWTTSGTPTDPQEDLQTVATHEIGHFLGLDHSAVVRAVMYPFAPSLLTTLSYDDVAGLSTIYPKAVPDFPTGTISGTVTFSTGTGVFGAHVFADSTSSAGSVWPNIRKSPISAFTGTNGSYTIQGVPPDTYTVGAEPLDLPVSNSDIKDYATEFGRKAVDSTFTTRWH
jgi:Matrixin